VFVEERSHQGVSFRAHQWGGGGEGAIRKRYVNWSAMKLDWDRRSAERGDGNVVVEMRRGTDVPVAAELFRGFQGILRDSFGCGQGERGEGRVREILGSLIMKRILEESASRIQKEEGEDAKRDFGPRVHFNRRTGTCKRWGANVWNGGSKNRGFEYDGKGEKRVCLKGRIVTLDAKDRVQAGGAGIRRRVRERNRAEHRTKGRSRVESAVRLSEVKGIGTNDLRNTGETRNPAF